MEANPGEHVLAVFRRRWFSEAVLAVANLGLADHVGEEATSSDAIARAAHAHPEAVYRLLRALSHQGIFDECGPRMFRHTPMSRTLRANDPDSIVSLVRAMGLPPFRIGATHYEHAITTGAPKAIDGGPFEYFAANPEASAIYDASQRTTTRLQTQSILDSFDFSALTTLIDVAGGTGNLLAAILPSYPALTGVLFDQAHVVEHAPAVLAKAGVAARCRIETGDFRTAVPSGGDGYILKNCLHGWNDQDSIQLLQKIHRSSNPGSRLLVIENVMPPQGSEMIDAFDLFLLLGGVAARVRTTDEFRALFVASGYELTRVLPLRGSGSIVEGRKIA